MCGAGEREFRPNNLYYDFDEKFSLSGMFQRIDNFLAKGLDEALEVQRERTRQERAELESVRTALGREFPQREELLLVRENHRAVIRELQRMQDEPGYVSSWTPKTSLVDEQSTVTLSGEEGMVVSPTAQPEKQSHTLRYGEGEGRTEYLVTNQHNGHTLKEGYVLRRTYFNSAVGSLGQSLYDDGKWHSTTTVPQGVKLRLFASVEEGLTAAREDAGWRGLMEASPVETAADMPEPVERHDKPEHEMEKVMSQARDSKRVYLAVPYREKNEAKAAGAEWDSIAASWYVGPDADMKKLEK